MHDPLCNSGTSGCRAEEKRRGGLDLVRGDCISPALYVLINCDTYQVDAYRNPYTPGAGVRPSALTGRDEEIERFRVILGRLSRGRSEQSMAIHGLRGVGKTVLLNRFEQVAREAGWASAFREARRDEDFRAVLARALAHLIRTLERQGRASRVLDRLKAALTSFQATITSGGELAISFEVDPTPGLADSGDLETDLVEILVELGEAAREAETGVALLLDELQLVDRTGLEAMAASAHRLAQLELPVAIVGAGLPSLPGRLVEAKSYSERLFRFPRLSNLGRDSATDAVVLPARSEGVEFEPQAIETILDASEGYPYFLQEWGRAVWNAAPDSPIRVSDVEDARSDVDRRLAEGFFAVRLERATAAERRYCAAMADLGDGPQQTAAIATQLGRQRPQDVTMHRAALIEKGLIYSVERGLVDFTVPHFAAFMRRAHPHR